MLTWLVTLNRSVWAEAEDEAERAVVRGRVCARTRGTFRCRVFRAHVCACVCAYVCVCACACVCACVCVCGVTTAFRAETV
mmetsp:Transcript_5145/g.17953  ORF Transcript_5145/g.17953 Transcript_5145/m.17953 type:complete len:81 (-) Transcript_5145:41-283(-)